MGVGRDLIESGLVVCADQSAFAFRRLRGLYGNRRFFVVGRPYRFNKRCPFSATRPRPSTNVYRVSFVLFYSFYRRRFDWPALDQHLPCPSLGYRVFFGFFFVVVVPVLRLGVSCFAAVSHLHHPFNDFDRFNNAPFVQSASRSLRVDLGRRLDWGWGLICILTSSGPP